MKYGYFIGRCTDKAMQDIHHFKSNIGDNVQGWAILNLYKKMGINKSQIVGITPTEMHDYSGDYIIVPFAEAFSNYKRMNIFPPSPRIIPVMISLAMCDEECDDIVPYLKSHEPIGCRDEVTMDLLRRKGIESYLSGCLTITLPKRKHSVSLNEGKVFLVDIPNSLKAYIPDNLLQNAEYITHSVEVEHYPMSEADIEKVDITAKNIFRRYNEEAALIVTSRLHAAAPCIAMGIPVIIATNNIDYRFSWIDKFVPIYTPNNFININWNPVSLEIEDIKKNIFDIFQSLIKSAYESCCKLYDLSTYYETRISSNYNDILSQKIENIKTYNENFKYIICGAGVHGKLALQMMSQKYPRAECVCFVDKYIEQKEICGQKIMRIENLTADMFDFALIASYPGKDEYVQKMQILGGKNYILFMSKNEDD
ncbi:MAG: polysaccharide pyruvyl transferase family protein [Clostridium sp.]|nr:polysaccharide pyruvyl transferase family protein [Clostridium sp.]